MTSNEPLWLVGLLSVLGPTALLIGIQLAPKGIWAMGGAASRSEKIKLLVQELKQQELDKISSTFLKNAPDDSSYQLSKLRHAIDYAIQRHDWYEAQRANILNSMMTVGGVVIAALVLYAESVA